MYLEVGHDDGHGLITQVLDVGDDSGLERIEFVF